MPLDTLSTPAALIDTARVQRNISTMQQRMNGLGVALRPHVKTSKCVAVVERQMATGARGITVSTLKEPEQFLRRAPAILCVRWAWWQRSFRRL